MATTSGRAELRRFFSIVQAPHGTVARVSRRVVSARGWKDDMTTNHPLGHACDDAGSDTPPDTEVALALAEAVRSIGKDLGTEPRRVNGVVSDLLGAAVRTRRAEVDAVVLAAEEGIPEDLVADALDPEEAAGRLTDRGLGDDLARFAVAVWTYALGLLDSGAEPPSLTNTVTRQPLCTDGATVVPDDAPADCAGVVGGSANVAGTTTADRVDNGDGTRADEASGRAGGTDEEDPVHGVSVVLSNRRGRLALAAVGAAAALAVVAGLLVAVSDGDTDTEVAAVEATRLAFAAESTPLGELTREWVVADGELTATLEFDNTTDAPTTGRHTEVVPKSMAASASLISSAPAHIVIKEDPVIAWDLTVAAGATSEVTYRIDVADDTDIDDLERWKVEQAEESAAFSAERDATPPLTLETPDGQVVGLPEVDIAGSTDPTNTVTVNGNPATVDEAGRFVIRIGGLVAGPNTIGVTATNPRGTAATTTINIVYEVPAAPAGSSEYAGGPELNGEGNGVRNQTGGSGPGGTGLIVTPPGGGYVVPQDPTGGGGNTGGGGGGPTGGGNQQGGTQQGGNAAGGQQDGTTTTTRPTTTTTTASPLVPVQNFVGGSVIAGFMHPVFDVIVGRTDCQAFSAGEIAGRARVTSQSPSAGTMLMPGSRVVIDISCYT